MRPMKSVLMWGIVAGLVALVVAVAIGYLLDGLPGVWGAVLGVGLSVLFFTATVALALATARLQPQLLGVTVLVAWLVKMIVLLAVLVVLDQQDFYSRAVFFGSLLICTVGYLGMEAMIVARTKVLYLETEFAPESPGRS
jgi:hypothetical protein